MSTTRYVRLGIVALVVGLTVFAAGPGPASAHHTTIATQHSLRMLGASVGAQSQA